MKACIMVSRSSLVGIHAPRLQGV